MATYLYCLVPAASDATPGAVTGLAEEPVRRLAAGRISAWVGTVSTDAVVRSVEAARRHDAVIRAAMAQGVTPLPARWGQLFDDDAACTAELQRREPSIAPAMDRVQGCVEMNVHALLAAGDERAAREGVGASPGERQEMHRGDSPESSIVGPGAGRAYLQRVRRRLDTEHKVQTDAAASYQVIAAELAAIVRDESIAVQSTPRRQLVIAHLVPRAEIARYRTIIEALKRPEAVTSIRVTGPHPPYSFTEPRDAGR